MSGRLLSLAAGTLREFGPVETVRAAAGTGFTAVGVWVEAKEWSRAQNREVRAVLDDTGLVPLDVEVIWLKPELLAADHLKLIDIGAELGARNALVVSSDPDVDATAAKLARLCEHAAPAGMRVSLEFALFTEVKTIAAAEEIVTRCGHPNAGILIDPLHLARSGGSPADVAALPRAHLAYAQLCDAPLVGADPGSRDAIIAEALDDRFQVGEGALPLHAVLDALPADLPLSVELRSKTLRDNWPDPHARAVEVARVTRAWLASRPR